MRLHRPRAVQSDPLHYFRSHLTHAQTISQRLRDGRGTAMMSRENMDLHLAAMQRLSRAPAVARELRENRALADAYGRVRFDPVGRD